MHLLDELDIGDIQFFSCLKQGKQMMLADGSSTALALGWSREDK